MCAIEAGKRGRRVAVLEHAERVGKKILISGGGRCNFTNLHTQPENFLSANPHFAKSALARYTPADFIALVEKHRHSLSREKAGPTILRSSGRDITGMLEQECRDAGVEIRAQHRQVEQVFGETTNGFTVQTEEGTVPCRRIGRRHGRPVDREDRRDFFWLRSSAAIWIAHRRTRMPALVPFVFSERDRKRWCDLAGVSTEVVASICDDQTGHFAKTCSSPIEE